MCSILVIPGSGSVFGLTPTQYFVRTLNDVECVSENPIDTNFDFLSHAIQSLHTKGVVDIAVGVDTSVPSEVERIQQLIADIPGVKLVSNTKTGRVRIIAKYKDDPSLLVHHLAQTNACAQIVA